MVSRTSRTLLVLATLAITLFLLVELPRRRAEDRARDESDRLARFDPSVVDGVTIVRESDSLSFAMRDSHWELTAPVADWAEPSAVLSLIDAIHSGAVARNLGPSDDDRRFHLDAPDARIVMTAAADTVFRMDLGGYTVDLSWVYARAGSRDVMLVPTNIHRLATRPLAEYRNQRVVIFDRAVVASFRLRHEGADMRWWRDRAGGWFTVSGRDTIAGDSVAVESVLRRLRGLRVGSFVAPQDTAGVFSRPGATVTLFKNDGAPPVTLRFAPRVTGAFWARDDANPRVVSVEGEVAGLLAETTTTLRDRRLVEFAPENATRIEYASPDTSGALVRAGARWAHPNPALGAIDPARAAAFVRELRYLRWSAPLPVAEGVPAGTAPFSLVVYGRGDTILASVRAWPRPGDDGTWIVQNPARREFRVVDAASLTTLDRAFRAVGSQRPAAR